MSIGVNAIERMLRTWPGSHVGEKVLKTANPAIAYSDPSAAVVAVADIGFDVTARLHCNPGLIFERIRSVVGGNDLAMKTAATRRPCLDKVGRANDSLNTANALAQPTDMTALIWATRENRPTPKLLASEIKKLHNATSVHY